MTERTLVIDTDTFLAGLPQVKTLQVAEDQGMWRASESPYRDGLDNCKRALIWRDEATEAQMQVAVALSGNGKSGDVDLCLWIAANTDAARKWCVQYGGNALTDVDECAVLNANDADWMITLRGDWSKLQTRLQATFGVPPVPMSAFVYLLTGEVV